MKQTIKELAETETIDVRGATVGTKYGLQPIEFLKEIVDAAKKQLFFANWVKVYHLPKGSHDIVIPKRTTYEGRSGMTFNTAGSDTGGTGVSGAGTGPYANTIADITWTSMDNLSNITLTPAPVIAGYAIRRFDIETNIVNLLEAAKDELSYSIGDRVDRAIATTIGDAQDAGDTTLGAQALYGGDANSDASGQLAAGDVITTDLVATAARYLKDTTLRYRASGGYGAESVASISKNPWQNTPDDPFVLFIGPAQEETFLKDSQFVNAAEYGSNVVIQNGEIGSYLGVRIVVTTNVEQVASGGTGPISGSATGTASTLCIMMKPKKACALVWGKDPEIRVFDYHSRDQIRIGLYCAYAIGVIHPDAIVFISVADA